MKLVCCAFNLSCIFPPAVHSILLTDSFIPKTERIMWSRSGDLSLQPSLVSFFFFSLFLNRTHLEPMHWIVTLIPSLGGFWDCPSSWAMNPKSPQVSPSHIAVSFLCRWWSSTPHRSFCPMTAPGSMPCLLLKRTRSLSRAESSCRGVSALWSIAVPCLGWAALPARRNLAFPDFIFRTAVQDWLVCFTFRESDILIIVFIPYTCKQNLVFVLNCTLKGSGNRYYKCIRGL